MNVFKLAWRNLWRNKRRTLITVSSIFFGVIFSSFMGSSQAGGYTKMIDNVVKFYSGFFQLQNEDYWDEKSINNSFELTDSLKSILDAYDELTNKVPRLEDFALASYETYTRGAIIVGTEPEKENQVTEIAEKIVEGEYLKTGDDGIIIGVDLAKGLKISVGDTLVLLGQGYHGVSAAGKFPVRGLIKHFNPEYNRRIVYMDLATCQYFYSANNLLTSLVVMVEDNKTMEAILPALKEELSSPHVLKSWQEMFPALVQQIESDRSTALIMKVMLYIVIGFGIFGTIMMMMAERKHEFGVMVAIGMSKQRLALTVVIETILMGMVGVAAGLLGSFPVVGYFYQNPIPLTGQAADWMQDLGFEPFMFFAWDISVFMDQVLAVFVMTLLISILPLVKLLRMHENTALHQ